jgi:hypothetical protein
VAQPKMVEQEKHLYFVTSFLASVTLSYYLARLMGGGTPVWGFFFLPIPILAAGFWLYYPRAKSRPMTIFVMNAFFAFLSLIAVFLLFQLLSALRG